MLARRWRSMIAAAAASFLVAAAGATYALAIPDTSMGRRPPEATQELEFRGRFHRAPWEGVLLLRPSKDGTELAWVTGSIPATCRDSRDGHAIRAGKDGQVGIDFGGVLNAPIQPDGSFTFTLSMEYTVFAEFVGVGMAPISVTVNGTFYGSNVVGRVRARAGKSSGTSSFKFTGCSGDQPFWARRVDPPS